MAEEIVEESVGIESIENLIDRIDAKHREAEAEAPSGQTGAEAVSAEPAAVEPEPAATPQPVVDWRDVTLDGDDLGNDFFRGKKVPEVLKSYKSLLNEFQTKTARLAQLEREQEQARQAQAAQQAQASQPDYRAAIKDKLYEDPDAVATTIEELAAQKARQIWHEEQRKVEAQQALRSTADVHRKLADYVASEYGLDAERAQKIVVGTYPHLTQMRDAYGIPDAFENPNYAWNTVVEMLGPPPAKAQAPAIQAPPVPQLSDPPGSGRPTASPRHVSSEPSPLAREQEANLRAVAKELGIDPKAYVDRVAAKLGGNRG